MKKIDKLFSKKLYLFYFICSIMVVYIHTNPYSLKIIDSFVFSYIYNVLYTVTLSAVPFFFLTSGFLLYKELTFETLSRFYFKKIKRYLIPFVLWSFICFLTIDYLRNMDYNYIPLYLITSSFDGPLWFIEVLIIFIVISPVFLFLLKSRRRGFLTLVMLFILINVINIPKNSDSIYVNYLYPFQGYLKIAFPYYFLGAFLGKYYYDYVNEEKYLNKYLIFFSGIIIVLLYIICLFRTNGLIYNNLCRFQAVLLWIIFPRKIFNYKDYWWYHRTFFTFSFHWILIWMFSKLCEYFSFVNKEVPCVIILIYRLVACTIITFLCIIIAQIIKSLFPQFYYILIGEKKID